MALFAFELLFDFDPHRDDDLVLDDLFTFGLPDEFLTPDLLACGS